MRDGQYYNEGINMSPPYTMSEMQEISQNADLWYEFLQEINKWRNKWFIYGMIGGTLLVALLQIIWNMVTP